MSRFARSFDRLIAVLLLVGCIAIAYSLGITVGGCS